MTLKTAKCGSTQKEIALSDGFFVCNIATGEWSFVSIDAPQAIMEYNVPVNKLVNTPEALVDWLAHLNEKSWFDAKKFLDFFTRFREENDLFNSL